MAGMGFSFWVRGRRSEKDGHMRQRQKKEEYTWQIVEENAGSGLWACAGAVGGTEVDADRD